MAKLGINTGSAPNDGTGDTLLQGALKINSNFNELYSLLGDGSVLSVGVVTAITAGNNISISTSYGRPTISVVGLSTANVKSQSVVVTGVSTLGNTVVGGAKTELLVKGNVLVTGVSTFTNNVNLKDNDKLLLGDDKDFEIFFNGSNTILKNKTGNTGEDFFIQSDSIILKKYDGSQTIAQFNEGSSVDLYFNNSKKFQTTGVGVSIAGISSATTFVSTQTTGTAPIKVSSTTLVSNLNADLLDGQEGSYYTNASNLSSGTISTSRLPSNIVISGVITAPSFVGGSFIGDGSNLTGIVTSITAGSGILIDQSTGNVTISGTDDSIQGLDSVLGIGNTSDLGMVVGVVTATDFNSTSDINLKENITTVDNALDVTNRLRGVRFEWKKDGRPSYGVIAQELQEILPELVSSGDPKTVNYNGIIGVLIEAVKELSSEIKELKKE